MFSGRAGCLGGDADVGEQLPPTDQRHRARHGLPFLGMVLVGGRSPTVTDLSCQFVFNGARKLLYSAITAGHAERLGIDTGFLTAIPFDGTGIKQRSRNPFSDDVARALMDETNLRRLEELDLNDRGLRDIWETIVATGRRCSEVVGLRLDCIGRYRSLAMLWHDQTKVGNYNEGIRIPEPIYQRLDTRRTKTLQLFEKRYGRTPAAAERAGLALFPSRDRQPPLPTPLLLTAHRDGRDPATMTSCRHHRSGICWFSRPVTWTRWSYRGKVSQRLPPLLLPGQGCLRSREAGLSGVRGVRRTRRSGAQGPVVLDRARPR
ncbi:hypothetical protein ACIP96_35235 [Streptomyces nigra]|uniref:hypothetical protein n=1 Tax=Streptomyces nigra TaxID=1827580 RepID=UPI00381F35E5